MKLTHEIDWESKTLGVTTDVLTEGGRRGGKYRNAICADMEDGGFNAVRCKRSKSEVVFINGGGRVPNLAVL